MAVVARALFVAGAFVVVGEALGAGAFVVVGETSPSGENLVPKLEGGSLNAGEKSS